MRSILRQRPRGFTMIELVVVVTLIAMFAVLAVPSFQKLIDKYRLKSAAEAMAGELQFARSEAVKLAQPVYMKFNTGANSCYGIGTTSTCTCSTCEVRTRSATELAQDFPNIQISAASTVTFGGTAAIDLTVAEPSITLNSTYTSRQLKVIVNPLGVPRICAVSGSMPDYSTCP